MKKISVSEAQSYMQNSQRPLHSPDAHNGQRWDGEEIWRLNASRFPVWVAGTWLLEQLLWPLKVCSVRKLESGASQKADLDTLIERWVTKYLLGELFEVISLYFFKLLMLYVLTLGLRGNWVVGTYTKLKWLSIRTLLCPTQSPPA